MNGGLDLHPKVAGASLAGALGLIVVWLFSLGHITVPNEVAAAIVLALTFAGGWAAPTATRTTET